MTPRATHVSINVSDLGRAVAFYETLFGVAPAKHASDYAKFELDDPPLVLSLEPVFHRAGDALNHLGLRLPSRDALDVARARLEAAGVSVECEDVECCYSRQSKFWLADPDKNLWEVYALTGDIDHRGSLSASDALAARQRGGGDSTWEHRLGDPLPIPLPLADQTVDAVRLRGTFNSPRPREERLAIAKEAFRVLRPTGQLVVHGLVTDRALSGEFPRLPGPAALVRDVPLESEPLRLLEEAGFVGAFAQKLGECSVFVHGGASMRELLVVAWRPDRIALRSDASVVVYKGPFREVTDDAGASYRRGERVTVDARTVARLKLGALADEFVFLGA
jgi:catechol 2,3-dioxygenase-like lactoylglutathione lyase family enzyme